MRAREGNLDKGGRPLVVGCSVAGQPIYILFGPCDCFIRLSSKSS